MTSKRKNKEAWAPTGFEEWGGYMAAKKAKLEEQFHERAAIEYKDTSNIFQGICIFVNGYTKPSADDLRLLMMKHSGIYHYYLRPRITTHVIATNLPYSKIMTYKNSQNPLPICKPEWITDSIVAGKLLNFQDYLLYSSHTKTQPKLAFSVKETKNEAPVPDPEHKKAQSQTQNETKLPNESKNLKPGPTSNQFSVPGTSRKSDETLKTLESSTVSKETSPLKESGNKSSNSTKNPEFLSEFYNNSRLHHISTMGAVFKDYINELRDKSNKTFPGLENLKEFKKSKKQKPAGSLDQIDSDSEEELLDSPAPNSNVVKEEAVIMHIDMDCFFVSVGLRNKPELKGFPVAVTHAKGNKPPQNGNSREIELKMYKERFREKLNKTNNKVGEEKAEEKIDTSKYSENSSLAEIASCSYEARKAGIKNGMFLGQALKLCPDLKMIPYDFEGYKEVSYALYDTVATYTLDIEAVSCDEMYADCTKIISETGVKPLEFAEIIRKQITEKTGCPVSTGFGKNKLQARLATRKAKPNGQFHLEIKDVQRYMSAIIIRDLPGVGATMTYKLNKMGVHTCAELQSVSLAELQKEFGKKTGEMLHNVCRGIDNSKLNLEHVRKSVSAEVNYGIRFENMNDAEKFLKQLSEEVCNRLSKANVKGRCVTLKLMIRSKNAPLETAKYMGHGLCDHFTRSKNLISPVSDLSIVTKEVLSLWHQLQQKPEDVRGVGIQISRLESTKKSGNSNLMAFIGKAKQPNADNKPKTPSNENVPKETKPRGLDGFLIAKEFPPATTVTKNSTIGDTSRSIPNCDPINRGDEFESMEREVRMSKIEDNVKSNASSPKKDDNSSSRKAEGPNRPSDERKLASTSKGERRLDDIADHRLMQDIDESVLAELPEDIRNEIIIAAKKSDSTRAKDSDKKEEENPPLIQKKQDAYFKASKRNIERPKKSEMPSLQEIDLAVLLELPDDIRNEILNEYRTKANESKQSTTLPKDDEARSKSSINEAHLSISQIDPEVLAALPKDIQNDVKDYCASKKKLENKAKAEQETNKKNVSNPKQFGSTTSKLMTANQKTARQQTKGKITNAKISKTSKSKKNLPATNAKSLKQSPESKQRIDRNDFNHVPESVEETNAVEIQNVENKRRENVADNIHSLSMAAKSGDPDDQKILLKLLVEEFMNLPLKEVKLQIQNWISGSDSVNEVDFLSFTTFLSSLPKEKRIEDLHVLIKTMHRCIEKTRRCIWHRAYRKTVEHVQRHMLATYDSSLMVPSIECEHEDCRNSKSF